jgi:hypothetical protein
MADIREIECQVREHGQFGNDETAAGLVQATDDRPSSQAGSLWAGVHKEISAGTACPADGTDAVTPLRMAYFASLRAKPG